MTQSSRAIPDNQVQFPDSSQPAVTTIPGDMIPLSHLQESCTHVVHRHTCRLNTHINYF